MLYSYTLLLFENEFKFLGDNKERRLEEFSLILHNEGKRKREVIYLTGLRQWMTNHAIGGKLRLTVANYRKW